MLRSIEAWDFCQFEHFELNLEKQGMVWVAGENRDTKGASSNGAGKTTISKAITWGLYGKVIDQSARNDEIGDAVIRIGAKNATVKITFRDGSFVQRTRSKGKPLVYLCDAEGNAWDGGDIQARIIELVGLDFHGFKNTCLFGQNDAARFASPRTSDQQRKDMLHKLLRTEVLGDCAEAAKKRQQKQKKKLGTLNFNKELLESKIAGLELEEKKAAQLEWAVDQENKIKKLREEIEQLKEDAEAASKGAESVPGLRVRIELIEGRLTELGDVAAELDKARSANDAAQEARYEARGAVNSAMIAVEVVKQKLKALHGDTCEHCNASLKEGAPKAKIDALREERTNLENEHKNLKKAIEAAIRNHEKSEVILKTAEEQEVLETKYRKQISDAKLELVKLESGAKEARVILASARSKAEDVKALKAEINPYAKAVEKAEAANVELGEELESVRQEINKTEIKIQIFDFWVKGFGIHGLQSFVLDEAMPYLTERANHYLETLSDGDINVSFATQREMKSSAIKEEIKISWEIEGTPNKTPSGGQQRKIEIATDFAFMDLAATREGPELDIFIADEIFDGLDEEGRERALALLTELRKRKKSIFVISHSASMSELFEKQITVIREDGKSSIARESTAKETMVPRTPPDLFKDLRIKSFKGRFAEEDLMGIRRPKMDAGTFLREFEGFREAKFEVGIVDAGPMGLPVVIDDPVEMKKLAGKT